MKRIFLPLFVGTLLSGCIGLGSVSVSEVVAGSDAKASITAESSGMGFLALTVPSEDLERDVIKKLAAQGATKNVSTRLTMRNFVIVQLYSVTAVGQK